TIHKFKNGRGIIGALAAIGFTGEKTYELISYRNPSNYGKKRQINLESVHKMNEKMFPRVFDNIDAETGRILITPHGNDPVFCGIRGISKEGQTPRIIAFLERNTAYASADLAGQNRLTYSPLVRIIRVPSTGRIGLKHLLAAFAAGADGIVFIEGDDSVFTEEKLREHVIQLKRGLSEYGVEPLRLIHTTTTIPQYDKILNIFETFTARISKMGSLSEEKRAKIEEKLVASQPIQA
ncbi:MAG: DUF1743 domain-containing protein, partial [Nitrososphaerota archaeon]